MLNVSHQVVFAHTPWPRLQTDEFEKSLKHVHDSEDLKYSDEYLEKKRFSLTHDVSLNSCEGGSLS